MRKLTLLCLFALALSACGRTHADAAATAVGTSTSIALTDTATLPPHADYLRVPFTPTLANYQSRSNSLLAGAFFCFRSWIGL